MHHVIQWEQATPLSGQVRQYLNPSARQKPIRQLQRAQFFHLTTGANRMRRSTASHCLLLAVS